MRELLRRGIEGAKEEWSRGTFSAETIEKVALFDAQARGRIDACRALLELEYEQLSEGLRDG